MLALDLVTHGVFFIKKSISAARHNKQSTANECMGTFCEFKILIYVIPSGLLCYMTGVIYIV